MSENSSQQNIYVVFSSEIQTIEGQSKVGSTVLGGLPKMDNLATIEFDPNQVLQGDEWWCISLQEEDLSLVQRYLVKGNGTELNQYKRRDRAPIAIYEYSDNDFLVFRAITPKMMIQKSILFLFDGGFSIKRSKDLEHNQSFMVDECPTAIYDLHKRRILFKAFRKITKIFPGIDKFYREASQEEIAVFKTSIDELITIDTEFQIGTRNLHLIAQIMDTKELLDEQYLKRIREISNDLNIDGIHFDGSNPMKISTDKELNDVLKLIQGWFYRNPITEVPMEASSAKKVAR